MGTKNSIPEIKNSYHVFVDDYKIFSTDSYEAAEKLINDIKLKFHDDYYNLFIENNEKGYKIIGYPKNQPVIYPIVLHSVYISG